MINHLPIILASIKLIVNLAVIGINIYTWGKLDAMKNIISRGNC